MKLPPIGIGTWQMGGRHEPDTNRDVEYVEAIQGAIAAGFTHIDTAEMYGDGHTEELVGQATQNLDRSSLILTSKVWSTHLAKTDIRSAIEGSLKRLKTTYLDLYLVHAPNPEIPLKETMHAMDALVEEGLTKHIGVSNFTIEQIDEAIQYSTRPIFTNQIHYSLLSKGPEKAALVEHCRKKKILVTAYRPLGKGILATNPPRLLQQLAKKYKKTPAQIAINWLISQKNVVTLVKMTSKKHIEENREVLEFTLSDDDIRRLDSAEIGDVFP